MFRHKRNNHEYYFGSDKIYYVNFYYSRNKDTCSIIFIQTQLEFLPVITIIIK